MIVPTTDGEDVASYTHNLFNKWGIGRQKENNGVLLLVAKNDRKLFIATGRGLEAALPDAIVSSIIRHDITPYFKQELYAQGIAKGLSSIIAATQGEYAPASTDDSEEGEGLEIFFFMAIVIFFIFHHVGRRGGYISPSSNTRILRDINTISHQGGFGRSSNGFGGGSHGGFGGGRSGGGGAGGSW